MAKGLGIIGNFKGKVGNIVGYNLKDSNNKQTQGLRAYQPVVRNPKTARQAEQRAKMAPINATYRALKGIIDRGQEGVAYGNKSRLRFLSEAMKQFDGPWFDKGEAVTLPIKINLTKGSLPSVRIDSVGDDMMTTRIVIKGTETPANMGALFSNLLEYNADFKEGDQLTFVHGSLNQLYVYSFIIDTTSTAALDKLSVCDEMLALFSSYNGSDDVAFGCVIVSREGESGQHLRSTTALTLSDTAAADTHYTSAAKDAAIESYMAANGNTDWPEESL